MKFFSKLLLPLLTSCIITSCNNGDPLDIPDSKKVLDHLIIEEICYTGSWHEKWKNVYKEDQYIKITNPTDHVIYLDGMALAQSGLSCRKLVNLRAGTDHRNTHFGASIFIRFPGKSDGQEYPINSGKSVYIAKIAYDHTKQAGEAFWCENSYDLSGVNFEWATVEQIENENEYPENPHVPNMLAVYPIEDSDNSPYPHDLIPEYGALALVKLPADVTVEMLLKEKKYVWNTTWTELETAGGVYQEGGGHKHDNEYDPVVFLALPNEWIIDAVQICPQQDFQWNVVSKNVDNGYCSVYTSSLDKNRNPRDFTGKALKRKHDGKKFVDNDNSTVDFEVTSASLSKEK